MRIGMPLDPHPATTLPSEGPQDGLALDASTFRRLANLVNAECGIELNESKSNLIVSRLGRRLKALGLADFDAYCGVIERSDGAGERRQMTSLLTTNVTRFFREPHHFDVLRTDVLPDLVARARRGDRIRIWSAGCSSGEEVLSIAMELQEHFADAENLDLRILGTDIDPVSIRQAHAAEYDRLSASSLTDRQRDMYFEPVSGTDRIKASQRLLNLVTYAELNLVRDWPMEGKFDIVFCRNVVIYLDQKTQADLWMRFAHVLSPGGQLFIGHSERITGAGQTLFSPSGITQYQRI
jgi:chemotaxis protein methyltransferase CheR